VPEDLESMPPSSPPSASVLWRPLLDGDAAERALAVVQEIAEALQGTEDRVSSSLDSGAAGIALFFSYLDRAFPGSGHDEPAGDFLERAILGTSQGYSAPSLYGGFPGVAWVVEHLLEPDEEDSGAEIAAAIQRFLERERRPGDFDLVSGLAGLGVYALERGRHTSGDECLRLVLRHLAREADALPEGIAWHTPAEHLVPEARSFYPQGTYSAAPVRKPGSARQVISPRSARRGDSTRARVGPASGGFGAGGLPLVDLPGREG
jgi:hypothetical protein